MLFLPEDYDYELAAVAHINREEVDAIWDMERAEALDHISVAQRLPGSAMQLFESASPYLTPTLFY